MMSQWTYVNVNDLHRQGWTINEIAAETGFHPATISKYLKRGPPPAARSADPSVMTEMWRERIAVMIDKWPRLLAVSVHNKLAATGSRAAIGGGPHWRSETLPDRCLCAYRLPTAPERPAPQVFRSREHA